jgi:AraC-like DNA-binding protein
MTDAALRARRHNLARAVATGRLKRLRSERESRIIKLLIRQSRFETGPRPSERTLAQQVRVSPSYIHKLFRKAHSEGMEALLEHGQRVTLDDLSEARRFTEKVRAEASDTLGPAPPSVMPNEQRAMTMDEIIAQRRREVAELKRRNPSDGQRRTLQEWREYERRRGCRALCRVPVR